MRGRRANVNAVDCMPTPTSPPPRRSAVARVTAAAAAAAIDSQLVLDAALHDRVADDAELQLEAAALGAQREQRGLDADERARDGHARAALLKRAADALECLAERGQLVAKARGARLCALQLRGHRSLACGRHLLLRRERLRADSADHAPLARLGQRQQLAKPAAVFGGSSAEVEMTQIMGLVNKQLRAEPVAAAAPTGDAPKLQ